MLKFIDVQDYTLLTFCKQVSPDIIEWRLVDGEKITQGIFVKGSVWPHKRKDENDVFNEIDPFTECQTLCPIFTPFDANIYQEKELEDYKVSTKAQINSKRDLLHHSGIEYNGNMFQTDPQSILDIMGACITNEDTVWLTMDNTQVNLTVAELNALGSAIAQRKKVLVYLARQYKDAIDSKTSKEEIDTFIQSITWSV